MAKRKGFFSRVREALRYVLNGDETGVQSEPKLVPAPPPPKDEQPLPSSGPIPGLSHDNDDMPDERRNRRQLVRQIMEWFSRDGAYWNHSAGRWVNEYGEMRSPARLSTVVHNISEFTNVEVEFGLMMSREEWQDLASRIEGYWYH